MLAFNFFLKKKTLTVHTYTFSNMTSSFALWDSVYIGLGQMSDKLVEASSSVDIDEMDRQLCLSARTCMTRLPHRSVFRYNDPLTRSSQLVHVSQHLSDGDNDDFVTVRVDAFLDTHRGETSALDDPFVRCELARLTCLLNGELPTASFSPFGDQVDLHWHVSAKDSVPYKPRPQDSEGKSDAVIIQGDVPDLELGSIVRVTVLRVILTCQRKNSLTWRRDLVNVLLPMVVARAGGVGALVPAHEQLFAEHAYVLNLNADDTERFAASAFLPSLFDQQQAVALPGIAN